jgi:hypothetical protein
MRLFGKIKIPQSVHRSPQILRGLSGGSLSAFVAALKIKMSDG